MSRQAKQLYEFGPFRLDPERLRLLRDGEVVTLTPKATEMLLVLIRNATRVVTKGELLEAIWPGTFVEEGVLTVNIYALRKALGEGRTGQKYIETISRRGYCFIADVREVSDEKELERVAPPAALVIERHTLSRVVVEQDEGGRGEVVEAGAVPRDERTGEASKKPSLPTAIRSLAVLPFKSLSADVQDNYLGLGMADALITKMSNIQQIIIRPTSVVRKYAGLEQDPIAAGLELMVDSVLDGYIQRSGERIRVTMQMVSVRNGTALWAEKFDAKFTDIFAVEDSISKHVADALTLTLSGEERKRLAKHYTTDSEAYQLYLKGRYYWNKWTEEGMKKAVESFQQATRKDSTFALAFAGMADCYAFGILPLSPREAAPRAKEAALKALEIDYALAEAHTSLAYVKHSYDWDWQGADQEFRQAIELNPHYAHAYHMYSHLLVTMNRFEESLEASLRACELDPLDVEMSAHLIFHYNAARQFDRAIEQGLKTLELDPNFHETHLFLGRAFEQKKMYAETIAEFRKAVELSGRRPFAISGLAHAYAVSGERALARELLDELKERSKMNYVSLYYIAHIYAGLGDREQALEWFDKAHEERDPMLVYLNVNPNLDSLRSEPRFRDLLRRVGLS
jgi:DNA-binding winged helix-turn-helix (wHTH) protein/TolB-like protein/Tfp pilus assembly protein PilF